MRRRSETVAAQPPMQQTSIPETQAPPKAPPVEKPREVQPHVSVDNGIVFIKCPDCGLTQSTTTAKRLPVNGKDLLHCIRCKGLLDPDEVITPEFIERIKREPTMTGSPRPQEPPKQPEPTPAAPPPPPPQKLASEAPRSSNWGPTKHCQHPVGSGVCGKELTQTSHGYFPTCGHQQEPPQKVEVHNHAAEGETVRVVWGEEVFNIGNYSNFRVGPFERSTSIRAGETSAQAIARLNDELREFASREFTRKAEAFLRSIDQLTGMLSEQENRRKAARA